MSVVGVDVVLSVVVGVVDVVEIDLCIPAGGRCTVIPCGWRSTLFMLDGTRRNVMPQSSWVDHVSNPALHAIQLGSFKLYLL